MLSNPVVRAISIPIFTGLIGYVTNWSGVLMLFQPVRFRGWRVPGLERLATLLPRKIQEIPGVMHGGIGWQGIVPSRAAKMGSLAVDTGIAKVGRASDFYQQLDPEKRAEQIVALSRLDIRRLVERIAMREDPQLWSGLPDMVREAVHARVQQQLPEIVHSITTKVGENIDQLLDIKLMVIRHIEANPALGNRVFLEVGRNELRFIQNFGFVCGLLLGIPMVFITRAFPQWWVLPIGGVIIGYVTNLIGIRMIYEPVAPRRIGRFTWQGLFPKRQQEAADVYAAIIAEEIMTLQHVGYELMHGPRADRTRAIIRAALRPAVDQAMGRGRPLVRVAVGAREYEAISTALAAEAVEYTINPLANPGLNRRQSARIRSFIAGRMRTLSPDEFSVMLRSVTEQDEWLLLLHGGVLGFGAGLLHLAVFG